MRYIDTGAMYRAITLYCLENKIIQNKKVNQKKLIASLNDINVYFDFNAEKGKSETILNGKNVEVVIREYRVSSFVSIVSQIKEVRDKLIILQRKIGEDKGVVMDGRDIGTKVFPYADLKFFITAKVEIRAQRRFQELENTGISFQQVLENLKERDEKDSKRALNPLKIAKDAIVIDNSEKTKYQQKKLIFNIINEKILASQ